VIGPGLRVLFCGINPSVYSAAVGHHFARPGNRFWPALHAAGLTGRVLSPWEDGTLVDLGYGLTNLVRRATAAADELTIAELAAGARALVRRGAGGADDLLPPNNARLLGDLLYVTRLAAFDALAPTDADLGPALAALAGAARGAADPFRALAALAREPERS